MNRFKKYLHRLAQPVAVTAVAITAAAASPMPLLVTRALGNQVDFSGLGAAKSVFSGLQGMTLGIFVLGLPLMLMIGWGLVAVGGRNALLRIGLPLAGVFGILITPGLVA